MAFTESQVLNIKYQLKHFIGSQSLYFHPFFKAINYTEGAQFIFHKCMAVWLCVDVCTYLLVHCKGIDFVKVVLKVDLENERAELIFEDDSSNIIFTNKYKYTDFPLEEIVFYYEYNILYLPSER